MNKLVYNNNATQTKSSLECEDRKLNNIPVDEAVKEFEKELLSYKKDVSKNCGKPYDPDILNTDYLAYEKFSRTKMFSDILAL